jgi:hypothetical protein
MSNRPKSLHVYRCCMLSDTHVTGTKEVPCDSDAAAIVAATDLLRRSAAYTIEVWDGARFVRSVDQEDASSSAG